MPVIQEGSDGLTVTITVPSGKSLQSSYAILVYRSWTKAKVGMRMSKEGKTSMTPLPTCRQGPCFKEGSNEPMQVIQCCKPAERAGVRASLVAEVTSAEAADGVFHTERQNCTQTASCPQTALLQ